MCCISLCLLLSIHLMPRFCLRCLFFMLFFFFFFNDTATTEIYTLSLHDALPISTDGHQTGRRHRKCRQHRRCCGGRPKDRKSTRLNSSHLGISYAVFCLKKKKKKITNEKIMNNKQKTHEVFIYICRNIVFVMT